MNTTRLFGKTQIAFVVFAALSLVLLLTPVYAQQATPSPTPQPSAITFSGRIDAVDARFIVVNGLLVDITGAVVDTARLAVGVNVTVFGNLQSGLIRATSIVFDDDDDGSGTPQVTPQITLTLTPTATPVTATSTPSPTPNLTQTAVPTVRPRIIIEGPVVEIDATRIRVFDIDITVDPTIVNITNIQIGDNVRVEGDFTVINTVINIVAVNITIINIDDRRSDRQSDRQSDRRSDRRSDRPVQPPPPPPPPARGSSDDSGRSSRSS